MSRRNSKAERSSISTSRSKKSKTRKSISKDEPTYSAQEGRIHHEFSSNVIVLRNDCLLQRLEDENKLIVPHNSPRSEFIYNKCIDTIPEKIKDVEKLSIPYVRAVGIKKTIEVLGDFFDCSLYKTSLLQFWFLDMLTDCLWKCQDEFFLTDPYQKSVLTWILYFFDIIRDPQKNLSRGDFFRLFLETMELAEEHIQCGDSLLPRPEQLFIIETPSADPIEYDELLTDSTDSSLSFDECSSERSFLVFASEEHPDIPNFFKLPPRECRCDISVTSSIETLSEKSIHIEEEAQNKEHDHHDPQEDENVSISDSISEFYQQDKNIHSRFLDALDNEEQDSENTSEFISSDVEYEWVSDTMKKPASKGEEKRKSVATLSILDVYLQPSVRRFRSISIRSKSKTDKMKRQDIISNISLTSRKRNTPIPEEKRAQEGDELIRAWFEYNLWEQRKQDMADPKRGWTPLEPDKCAEDCICAHIEYNPEDFHSEEYSEIKREWLQYLEKHKESTQQHTINIFVNSCLLLIIKEFVLDYFYETFQYKLVKMTYQIVPNLMYEKLNSKWQVPKESKGELKRPVEKKPKPPKPVKEIKQKSKEKKKDQMKDKKSNKSKRSETKEKKGKIKKEKTLKPTKEQKEEKERLKREEKIRREQEIVAEQNKRFIFPLSLAADEEFFKSIFKDYSPLMLEKHKKSKEKNKNRK